MRRCWIIEVSLSMLGFDLCCDGYVVIEVLIVCYAFFFQKIYSTFNCDGMKLFLITEFLIDDYFSSSSRKVEWASMKTH